MSRVTLDILRPQPTGGTIVTFHHGVKAKRQKSIMNDLVGSGVETLGATEAAISSLGEDFPAIMLEDTGIGIVPEREDSTTLMKALASDDSIASVRPEFWMYAIRTHMDSARRTWGIDAVQADISPYDGKGIKLAVLDTGLDLNHPDFVGRNIVSKSFVDGETVQDGQGHGTHCCGTAAGRNIVPDIPRYGVAPSSELYVGKVLGNQGFGRERDILNGMLWAIRSGCEVISMSLGRAIRPGERPSIEYERMGTMALNAGSLIVAAAGNESQRHLGFIAPVGAPANSRSIMAVAALDERLDVASFSCGGINPDGGEIDIAAPGVDVLSSYPLPMQYNSLRGTSMACPHVAGLAALWAQSDPNLRGTALWQKLTGTAEVLHLPARDVGAGLAKAPTSVDEHSVPVA